MHAFSRCLFAFVLSLVLVPVCLGARQDERIAAGFDVVCIENETRMPSLLLVKAFVDEEGLPGDLLMGRLPGMIKALARAQPEPISEASILLFPDHKDGMSG